MDAKQLQTLADSLELAGYTVDIEKTELVVYTGKTIIRTINEYTVFLAKTVKKPRKQRTPRNATVAQEVPANE